MDTQVMTYQQAAQTALDVQDAVNLSGVVRSFADAVHAIWEQAHVLGRGTDYVNTHPIVTLFLDKLVDLNGRERFDSALGLGSEYAQVYDAVKKDARGD